MFLFIIIVTCFYRLFVLLYREPSQRPDRAFLWEKAGPLSIFVSQEEPLFFSKGAMETVDERLKREATSYPARVEREGCFFILFILFLSLW